MTVAERKECTFVWRVICAVHFVDPVVPELLVWLSAALFCLSSRCNAGDNGVETSCTLRGWDYPHSSAPLPLCCCVRSSPLR